MNLAILRNALTDPDAFVLASALRGPDGDISYLDLKALTTGVIRWILMGSESNVHVITSPRSALNLWATLSIYNRKRVRAQWMKGNHFKTHIKHAVKIINAEMLHNEIPDDWDEWMELIMQDFGK